MNAPLPPSLLTIFGDKCCRPDVSNEDYHADRSCVSVSGLKQILRSPAHYRAYLDLPKKETPALFMGTALHAALLEPAMFSSVYVQEPDLDRRSKEYKEWVAANPDKRFLSSAQMGSITGVINSVSEHAAACALLQSGYVEHTLIWQDEETGIWIKIRPDCLCPDIDTGVCLDLKSTEDASPGAFVRSCVNYDYDLQAAVYLEGLRKTFKRDFDFCFLALEKAVPFGVALYGAPEEMLVRGRRRFRHALHLLQECRETNRWPSYQPGGDWSVLDWPRWAH